MSSREKRRLTRQQRTAAEELFSEGYIEHKVSFGRSQSNRQLWHLITMGLAEFGWGPKDSFLKCQGFLPVWSDPTC